MTSLFLNGRNQIPMAKPNDMMSHNLKLAYDPLSNSS